MSKELDTDSSQEAQEDRVIDSYIQKAVDAGEIKPNEFHSGGRSIFWDRNTIRAAVAGVIVLVVVNMVFFYTMRIDESDNTTQWELSKRDFLIEYRESRLKPDMPVLSVPELESSGAELLQSAVQADPEAEVISQSGIDSLEPVSDAEFEQSNTALAEQTAAQMAEAIPPETVDTPEEAITDIIEAAYVPEESQGEMAASDEASIRDFVQDWARAWSFQNVDAYLAHYSEDFISQGGAPFGPWSSLRAERLTVPEWIHVIVDDMRILIDQDLAVAEFIQVYSASNYSDDSRKTLVLRNESGQWKILEETSAPIE